MLAGLVLCGACGRSAPDPCRAREGLPCPALAAERAVEQGEYDAAVDARDGDAVALEGACVQALVREQLEKQCIADGCVELCALHPCALRDAAGSASLDVECVARCGEEVANAAIERAALDAALVRAARDPGLCTCAVCDDDTAVLCDALWVCAVDA